MHDLLKLIRNLDPPVRAAIRTQLRAEIAHGCYEVYDAEGRYSEEATAAFTRLNAALLAALEEETP